MNQDHTRVAQLWVPGDWNAFFGLFTNVLLNVIVLTGLTLGVVNLPGDVVYGRILPALGIALPIGNLYYAYLAWRLAKGGPERRRGHALRPERAAYVHRRLPDHAADLPEDQGPDPRLAGGPRLGVHHRRDRAVRRVRGSDHPQIYAARRHARHARRHLDRLHLDAAGVPDVGGALGRVRRVRHHPDQLDRQRPPAGRPAGRARSRDRRHRDRLDRGAARLVGLHGALGGRPVAQPVRAAPAAVLDRRVQGPGRHLAAARDRDPARRLQFHRGHEQRRECGRGRRQLQSAPHPGGRRHRRDRGLAARQPVPARGLHRPSRLESGRRPDRLFARDRAGDRGGLASSA